MDIVNFPKTPLTSSQLDIFLDQQRAPGSCLYNIGGYFQIMGTLDPTRLTSAVTAVVQAESAFHLQLDLTGDLPQQYLLQPKLPEIEWLDFYQANHTRQNANKKARQWVEHNFAIPFDLNALLFQLAICKISPGEHWLYLKAHHLVMDGWSYSLFIKRVMDQYNHAEIREPLTPLNLSYWKFIQDKHQRSIDVQTVNAQIKKQKERDYWRERLANAPDYLLVQRSKNKDTTQTGITTKRHQFIVGKEELAPLLTLARQQKTSAFHALLAIVYCYFMRATGTKDLVIGTPLHGRTNARNKQIIGMLASTSPTRINAPENITYNELLVLIRQSLLRDFRYQDYSLGQIYRDINNLGERRKRLYDVFVSYEDFSYNQINGETFQIQPKPLTHQQDQTPFSLFIRQYAISGEFEFDLQLHNNFFSNNDAHWIEGRLRHLITTLANQPDLGLQQLSWLPEQELCALQTINQYVPDIAQYHHVLDAFAYTVQQFPHKTAVIGCDKTLTYLELDQTSDTFAQWLINQKIIRGTCIGVCMDRSSDLLVVLLGIWKAGAAYIPLDPEYPATRLQQVVEHSQLQWVITCATYTPLFTNMRIHCCVFSNELISAGNINQHMAFSTTKNHSLKGLAYVIYTSGSTGVPKGVAIEQGSMANFLAAMSSAPGITRDTTLLAVTTISFDIHILELFLPLVNGATLLLATSNQSRDAFALRDLIHMHSINMMQATPATWKMLFHADWQPVAHFKALCGGEAMPPALLEKFGQYPQVELWNMYGPTEATVWSSTALIQGTGSSAIHLGHPIANSRYFVLDSLGYPAGFNLPGELYIGGHCLARDYIHDPEKTSASFLWRSLPGMDLQRIYKTGDSVELTDSHQLHFRSRNDDQVKVRGYRIELGDVEAALMKHPAIKDAAVKIWRDARDENYLAAYCVAKALNSSDEELANHLKQYLPEYMLPSVYTWLDALPLTNNGKIDRKALAEPQLHNLIDTQELPQTVLEQTIAAAWCEILEVKNPGRRDDFFRLGGDSISNVQLVNRLRKGGIAAEAADIFQYPRLMDLAYILAERTTNMSLALISAGEPTQTYSELAQPNETNHLPVHFPFPLSSAQQRLYILQQLESAETAYNMYGAFLVRGSLNSEQLVAAFIQLLQRHSQLCCRFYESEGELLQQPIAIDQFSLDQQLLPEEFFTGSSNWLTTAIDHFVQPFDLNNPPLVRAQLWRGEDKTQQHVLLIDIHHLVADGISINIFLHDLFAFYDQALLEPLPLSYRDFIQQQSQWFHSPVLQQAAHYWQHQFSGELPSLDFPADYTRPAQQQFSGKRLCFLLDKSLSTAVKQLARQHNISLFMLLLAAYNLLLAKYTGREDIIVGTPISNRPDEHFGDLVGLFVNTLPLRHYPSSEKKLADFLQEIKTNCSQALRYKNYPFEKLIEDLSLARDLSRNPLFDCILVLQAEGLSGFSTQTLAISPLPVDYQHAKFDLTLDAVDKGAHIQFELEYASHLFTAQRIQKLGHHFINLLQQMVEQPNAKISKLSLLDNRERHQLLHEFNNTEKHYPQQQTLASIFEQQANKTPHQVAVGFAGQQLSYRELNAKANQLAHQLLAYGISKNQIVAVMLERSLEMPIAILAIIKAGAAYLPISPNLPHERIEYMLADSQAPVLISNSCYIEQLTQFTGKIFTLDQAAFFNGPKTNPVLQSGPDDLAYVIYTSGSTGQPKGAMVEHRAVVNRIYWMQDKYPLSATDVILQKTPYTFDVSVWELFWWSFAGASVYFLAPDAEKDPQQIFSCIGEQRISILHFVPSMLTASLEFLAAYKNTQWNLGSLRYVFASGEALNPYQVEEFNRLVHPHSGAQLINLYGPTEAAIDVTYFDCPISGAIKRVPIGKPIDNIRLHILDSQQQLVAQGLAGELYISGAGVGRGYVNKPELTAEKFLPDPFFPGQRMYRTGDLCRWLEDGNIEYLGRLDHQVKIRGYRIELGEIETCLLNHPAIREATVIALKNASGQDYLCAYIVARTAIAIDQLRAHLGETLPDYMVPAEFVLLAEMPLNPSGKIDRKQLPAPTINKQSPTRIIDDSQLNKNEYSLLRIARELLNNHQLGLDDNFFHNGGDSIRAIQFSARAAQAGFTFGIRDIFKYSSLRQLANNITQQKPVPTQTTIDGNFDLTPIQLAFFEQNLTQPDTYCQYVAVKANRLSPARLQHALNLLIQQHSLLTAKVIPVHPQHGSSLENAAGQEDASSYQLYIAPINGNHWLATQFTQKKTTATEQGEIEHQLNQLLHELQSGICLDGPLYAAGILSAREQDYLLVAIHHLIIDGVSWRILLDDLNRFYQEGEGNKAAVILPTTTSPQAWIIASKACAQTTYVQKQFNYWQKVQKSIAPALLDPSSHTAGTVAQAHCIKALFTHGETLPLLNKAHIAYGTDTQDLLITAVALAWQQWTGKIRIALDLEAHGRNLPFNELDSSRNLGWFTAIYPWAIDVDAAAPLQHSIPHIKESLRRIPDKGIGYGLLKYFGTGLQQKQLGTPHPDILFNYLGHLDTGNPEWQLHASGLTSGTQNSRSHIFEITMAIKEGQLEWNIHYPGDSFSAFQINKFSQLVRAQLLNICAHCTQQTKPFITPSDLGDVNISLETYQQLEQQFAAQGPITAIHKLTPTQAGIFFHVRNPLHPAQNQAALYYEELGLYVNQALDAGLLQIALDRLSQAHSILRSFFIADDANGPRQVVCANATITLVTADISSLDIQARERWITQEKNRLRKTGFDWQQPLVRLHLFKTGTNESMFLLCYHHLVLDGWSCAALIEELLTTYIQLREQLPENNTPLTAPVKNRTDFGDYLQWLFEQNPEPARAYWRTQLTNITDRTRLPGEITPEETGYHLQETAYQLPAYYLQGLQQLAAQYDVTLNTLVQAAWGLLLQRYNNTGDVLFVSVVSGRTAAVSGIEKMLGLFINTIPVRIVAPVATDKTSATKTIGEETIPETIPETIINKKIVSKEDWTQWLHTVQNIHLQAEEFAFIGLADIANSAAIPTDLFRNLLVFENYPINNQALGNNLRINSVSLFEQTHYDFNLLVQPSNTLDFRFIVNTLVHPAVSVARIAGHLLELLRHWVDHNAVGFPDNIPTTAETTELVRLGLAQSTPLLNKEFLDKEFIDKACVNNKSPNDNLVSRFLQQRQLTPQALAVCDATSQLNYAQLAQQAQQIARHLLAQGITTEQPVVLLANRSCQMIAALLGILQSGAVVVPVDPHLPDERIHYLLTDSTASCVLVDDINTLIRQTLPGLDQYMISHLLDTDATEQDDNSDELPLLTGAQLLYLIYTSGTTGAPKGVMLEHRNLLALVDSQKRQGLIQFNKQVLQFATHSFDVCYQEIFSTLLAGGCLHIIDEQQKKDTDYLLDFIRERNIDTLFLPTAYLKFLFSVPERIAYIPTCIKHIVTAGEQLLVSPTLRQYLQERNVLLHNHYGPSETHVVTTKVIGNTLNHLTTIADIPPIGTPVDGTGIYLLDHHGRLQPRGAIGEIFIGGTGVGRGYWNKPSLTRERFLTALDFYTLTTNPYFSSAEFLTTNGDRIYRTGDLGYWSEAGELIYLGRADQQVKVRGYRIEPGEIEACLRKQPAVNEAAVIAHSAPQGDNYLVAYLVLEQSSPADITLANIKKALAAQLPAYMQPAFFVPLAYLPMTANGKLDKRALPDINNLTTNNQITFNQVTPSLVRRPTNPIQLRLASFWQELLALDEPDLDTDFFAVGGHSLNATSLAAHIQREWAIKISIKELFVLRTLEQQANAIAEKIAQGNIHATPKINELVGQQINNTPNKNLLSPSDTHSPAESNFIPGNWIPLSSAQQRLYVLDQLAGPSTSYNIPFAAQIQPDIYFPQLEHALQQLLERHTILRVRIGIHHGQPMQTLMQDAINIQRNIIVAEQLDNYLANWVKPFNLHKDVLIRIELVQIKETGAQWLLLDMHHIITDGVSIEILLRELMMLYRGEKLPAPGLDYAAVVHWQDTWQHSADFQIQKHYWLNRFHQLPPVLELPLDFARPPERNTAGAELSLPVDADLVQALEQFAQQQGTSIFAVALTAYALWLWRYSGETDMAIGIPVSGRSQPAFTQVPGLMVNSLAMRVQLDSEQSAETCLHYITTQLLEDLQHQDFPFDALIDALHNTLELPRDPGRNALIDTMFSLGNDWLDNAGAGEFFSPYGLPVTEAKFDLAMSLDRHQGRYSLAVNYATSLFTHTSAHQMARHYLVLLRQLIENPQQPIRKLNCLSPIEYRQLTLDFNNTEMSYPRDSSIAAEFEKIAARYSGRLAVHDDEGTLTYRELNELANRIAACLIHQGLTPQTFVGVMLERSRYWIASMLALFKAGAVYMPIAPDWPEERIRTILQDATASLLICTPDTTIGPITNINKLIANNYRQIYLDDLMADAQCYSAENISPACSAMDLAYVIYTSGSTGIPKGVLIEQRSVLNLTQWAGHEYDLEHNTRMLQMTSPGFDVSIEETLVPLLNGASVFILSDEYKMDKQKFTRFIQQHRIQIAELVPSLLGDYLLDNIQLESLALVITGAERLEPLLKDQILARGYRLHNVYGPTETTVNATSKSCTRDDDTIGKPMANSNAFILDAYGRVQPIGVPGELCISGDNLARGYHQRETLTTEKFVANPFVAGARLYRTGDLAKWTSDGEIRFIGRIDQQVKIRGYRIEIGDVENQLATIAGIHQAIVTVRQQETANANLCAYYTGPIALDETWLRQQLAQWLPDYMLPAHFIYLASIPLTSNGKVDKKALPQPELAIRTNYQAPRTPVELQLEQIWCRLLGGDNYSINEDFFRAGGHSLLAIKLLAAINQQWPIPLTLTEIFTHSVLEKLAQLIARRHEGVGIPSPKELYSLFNPAAPNTLFLFPPALGESMVYGRLSQQLPEYRCYCFNYLDDPERLEIYADTIVATQPTGKIYLLGYSAGGNLAFEVAQNLEARGHQLGGVVLLDSVRRERPGQVPEPAQISLDLQTAFARNQLELDAAMLTPLIEQAYRYGHYIEQLVNQGTLNVPVHLIKAHIPVNAAEDYGWAGLVPNLCIHAGAGEHLELLAEPNLDHNARVIAGCLQGAISPFTGVLEPTPS